MQPGRAPTSGLGVPLLPLARWVGWVASVRPTHGVLVLSCPLAALRVCSVLGRLAPVHRCARAVCCVASAVSWATWLLFTVVLARCVVLRVRCPGPLGSRSPVCALSLPLPFPCSSLFACLFCFFFLGGGGWGAAFLVLCVGVVVCRCRCWCGHGCRGGRGSGGCRALGSLCVRRPQASGFQGAGPGGADGGWSAAVVAWRLRGWSRLLGSAWVAWPGAGAHVGVFMAWAVGVVGSVGVAGLCGCRVCVRRRRGGLGSGTVGDAMGGGDVGDAYGGAAVGVETGWCCWRGCFR